MLSFVLNYRDGMPRRQTVVAVVIFLSFVVNIVQTENNNIVYLFYYRIII